MKPILLIFASLLFCGCGKEPNYKSVFSKEVTASFNRDMQNRFGLQLISSSGVFLDSKQKISLDYCYYGQMTPSKARDLMKECSEDFLYKINENERIRPYLANYPFQEEDLEINIWFMDKEEQKHFVNDKLAHVSYSNGEIYFSDYDSMDVPEHFLTSNP